MSQAASRSITNSFQDVRLISLASWSRAAEINPRDARGPYVVLQEGYDPGDLTMNPDEFLLGRSGRWLSLGLFYRLPVEQRRGEFVFGTVAEVMNVLGTLSSKVAVFRPGEIQEAQPGEPQKDELAAAIQAGRGG